jgi:uncharacterized protein YPO0396
MTDTDAAEPAPEAITLPLAVPARVGIRLQQCQLLNWGTFDGAVQRLAVSGANVLLTGQIGAGKSTIVDGLTTLFAAPSKVVFNRAAGADRSERSVETYVLGNYRNVFDEATGATRPEALRERKTAYSVVLARFTGLPDDGILSAGAAFYFEASGALHRMYFTAPVALDIAEHLTGHADPRAVRAALRAAGAEVFDDNFKAYQRSLCRWLSITPAALDLLVQTVSMKSVGNLTDFVRAHMLDAVDTGSRIVDILEHWGDLTRAYELVLTARHQLEKLEPVAEYTDRFDRADARITASREAAAAVPYLVEEARVELLADAIGELERSLPALRRKVETLRERHDTQRGALTRFTVAVEHGGGAELARAENEVTRTEDALNRARGVLGELTDLARAVGITPPQDVSDWGRFTQAVTAARDDLDAGRGDAKDAEYRAIRAYRDARDELARMEAELAEASTRDSNVPIEDAQLRGRIANALGLAPTDLPYAAELISVADDAPQWEAAAERLVHPLALSMLVPDEHYAAVAAWVDAQHLGRRLVYYRVPAQVPATTTPRPGSMAAKLTVRPSTRFTTWLLGEVSRRYDHQCVDTAAELAGHMRAVTRAGQIKDNARHEKDDRRRIDDRRFYVLGWDTAARRAVLSAALPDQRKTVTDFEHAADQASAHVSACEQRHHTLHQILSRFSDPAAIDVAAAHDALTEARKVHETIAGRADLAELIGKKEAAEARLTELFDQLGEAQKSVGDAEGLLTRRHRRRVEAAGHLAALAAPELSPEAEETLTEAIKEVGGQPGSDEGCDAWGRTVTSELTNRQGSALATLQRNGQRLVGAMKDFEAIWPHAVAELGTSVEARHEYLALREGLRDDDLPSYEADFRDQLHRNAIHELVAFTHFLDTESRKINGRIDTINSALADIDYRPGTYIRLENEPTPDPEIREFRAQLREITSNSVFADDETYAEERFLRVKALLDRFKGRDEHTRADELWTKRVTDVRNWHTFAASERTRDENAPVEHYTDSGGKSGGQKEKLAYTILAASLSYQYGLAAGGEYAFRFVMIDEAFGRGSDESTRFGLELFGRLELQLLVVTPLQKISTIEPFVEAVGYVRNDDPVSRLLTMTISEYRETRQRHLHQRRATRPGSPPAAMDADPDRGLEDGLADALDHSSGGLDPLSRVS